MKYEILRAENICKQLKEKEILLNLNLNLFLGEMLGLLVRNSTERHSIRDILLGKIVPDNGTLYIDDQEVTLKSFSEKHGIFGIYAISNLVHSMNIMDNMFALNPYKNIFEPVRYKEWFPKTLDLLSSFGLSSLSPYTLVQKLDLPTRHIIEILKAIAAGCKILILDNIINHYSEKDSKTLRIVLKQCLNRGLSIIYISNKHNSILQSADRVTITRDGSAVATVPNEQISKKLLTDLSAGYSVFEIKEPTWSKNHITTFSWQDVLISNIPNSISFKVAYGELISLYLSEWEYGVSIADVFYGNYQYTGQMLICDKPISIKSIRDTIHHRIAIVREYLNPNETFDNMSIIDNVTIMINPYPHIFSGLFQKRITQYFYKKALNDMGISSLLENKNAEDNLPSNISRMSQLKILTAKWLCTNPKVILFLYPELCLNDISINEFRSILKSISENGISIIVMSTNIYFLQQIGKNIVVVT
jgi:ABC-type sugar transport system ATPase subunit